jgi:hypothetical protein
MFGGGAGFSAINLLASLMASSARTNVGAGLEPTAQTSFESLEKEQTETALALCDRVDRLVLIVIALFTLMKEKYGVTDEELLQKIQEVDLLDGRPDGKVHGITAKCPQCGRFMSARHGRCLYCGFNPATVNPFAAVEASAVIMEEQPETGPLTTGPGGVAAQPWGEESKAANGGGGPPDSSAK